MATITVAPSGSGDYTTIAAAVTAAGSTDTIDIIEQIDEEVNLNKTIAAFTSSNGSNWRSFSWQPVLKISSGFNGTLNISSINFIVKSTTSTGSVFEVATWSANTKIIIDQCTMVNERASIINWWFSNAATNSNSQLTVSRCEIVRCEQYQAGTLNAGYTIKNCIFRDCSSSNPVITAYGTTNTIQVYNNTFDNNTKCIGNSFGATGGDYRNNVFCAYTTVIDFVASNTYQYNAHTGTKPSGADSTNIESINTTTAFTNYTSDDFHVKDSSSVLYNAGATIGAVTDDYDGVSRPQSTAYDIGAYELVVSPPTGGVSSVMVGFNF